MVLAIWRNPAVAAQDVGNRAGQRRVVPAGGHRQGRRVPGQPGLVRAQPARASSRSGASGPVRASHPPGRTRLASRRHRRGLPGARRAGGAGGDALGARLPGRPARVDRRWRLSCSPCSWSQAGCRCRTRGAVRAALVARRGHRLSGRCRPGSPGTSSPTCGCCGCTACSTATPSSSRGARSPTSPAARRSSSGWPAPRRSASSRPTSARGCAPSTTSTTRATSTGCSWRWSTASRAASTT